MAATELTELLKRTLASVEASSSEAQTKLGANTLSLKDQVEVGQLLWRIARAAQESLDPIKDSLRQEALHRQRGRPGRQFLSGRSRTSRCTVVVPQPEVKLRAGADVDALRQALGNDFLSFFTLVVAPRREFAERAEERPELVQVLAKAVDTVSEKPRVSFND